MQHPKTMSFNDQNQADNFVLSEESLSKNGEISNFDKYENQLSSNSPLNDDDQAKNYVIDEESLSRNGDNAESSNFENQLSSISIKQHETTLFNDEESLSKNGENAEISDLEEKIDGDFAETTFCDQDQEEKIEPNSSRGWRDSCEGEEGEGPVSPSSSGYVGGGSSGCTSRASGFINDDESNHDIGINRNVTPRCRDGEWIPGKRHIDEDDASMSWRKRKKHYIVLSHSGKPIYSRYGDEHKLAGFSATLQAIISFVENGGDRVKLVRAGKHQSTIQIEKMVAMEIFEARRVLIKIWV
ncbi:hypothetical protein LIER_36314 [Lithospermum erythrorhizon]|uniref:Vacuolar fusion protein MON1 homolog n=1 Tax=Lithospermum erythrorhizon TaxID=34254 RepID=A0AAV3P5F5_LITER